MRSAQQTTSLRVPTLSMGQANILALLFIVIGLVACTNEFIEAVAKSNDYKAREEVSRCQQGYQAACKKMIETAYARAPRE